MPAMLPERSVWTFDDLQQLPDDGQRYELLYGELVVTPSPAFGHQAAAAELLLLFRTATGAGYPVTVISPAAVRISETTYLEPDLAVYDIPPDARPSWRDVPVPLLVVEILSPTTRGRDRHRKRPEYLRHGIREMWTVDTERREIERWTTASEFPIVEREDFDVALSPNHAPIRVSLAGIFGRPES